MLEAESWSNTPCFRIRKIDWLDSSGSDRLITVHETVARDSFDAYCLKPGDYITLDRLNRQNGRWVTLESRGQELIETMSGQLFLFS